MAHSCVPIFLLAIAFGGSGARFQATSRLTVRPSSLVNRGRVVSHVPPSRMGRADTAASSTPNMFQIGEREVAVEALSPDAAYNGKAAKDTLQMRRSLSQTGRTEVPPSDDVLEEGRRPRTRTRSIQLDTALPLNPWRSMTAAISFVSTPAATAHGETTGSSLRGRWPLGIALAASLLPLWCAYRSRRESTVALGAKSRRPRWAPSNAGIDTVVKEEASPSTDLEINRIKTALEQRQEIEEPGNGRCFRVIHGPGIALRKEPSTDPRQRTGGELINGEVFEVRRIVRKYGRQFFELIDGRGWAFDWTYIQDERTELVEEAAQLYTAFFPDGIAGVIWSSDTTMQFCTVKGFGDGGDAGALTAAGMMPGDVLVMIDQNPVVGLPFGKVLERIWASGGRAPGSGKYYRVITESPYGIGVRQSPDMDGARTGDDLIRGEIFEVDDILEEEGQPTWLRLANGRGWVFDLSPIQPDVPTVQTLQDAAEQGCVLTLWRGSTEDLAQTMGLKLVGQGSRGETCTVSVVEEGQPVQRIAVRQGDNLRQQLVDNGFQVYANERAIFNCKAQQLCGTCVLEVLDGLDNLTGQSLNEKKVMEENPPGYRLCCGIDIYGDVVVRLRPSNIVYGGGTS